jgi:hypothetical protein
VSTDVAAQAASTNQSPAADLKDPWLRSYFISRLSLLDRARSGYWTTWRDIAQNFAPRRGRFLTSGNDGSRGRRRDQRIIDNTPLLSARIMASGMMGGISSPARPWFRLRFQDEATNEADGARAWLDEVQKRMLHVFAKSNLYNCLHTLYGELGDFGSAVLWVDEDDEDIVRGYTLTVGEYWLASSRRLAVDTVYRSMWWTVRQIVDEFGRDKVSAAIRASYDNGQLDLEYEIVQAVEPNPNAAAREMRPSKTSATSWAGRLASKLPWRSVWFERGSTGENLLLRVSGFEEFPVMAPRWETAGTETYGSGSPGWVALGDAQQLQVQQRRKLEIIDKLSKPPMKGPPSMNNQPASLLPGGMTYVSEGQGGGKFEAAIKVEPESVNAVREDIAATQDRIHKAFYADLFLMMAESDRREITAREVDERHEEKMVMLGPVLERLHDELLDPLVGRVFNIMARNGLIPPPPDGLDVATMQIEFISLLAQAQKAVNLTGIERLWQFGIEVAKGGKTDALDRLDSDGTMDAYADMLGTPAGVLVDLGVAKKTRAARQQQQQQAETLAQVNSVAETAKTASEIDVGGGVNAVQAMVGGAV